MRIRYKNKRDIYKEQAQIQEERANYWRKEAEKRRKELEFYKVKETQENKKRLACKIYCSNCMKVYGAQVPNGQTIKESGCAFCGVKNCGYLVVEIVK